MNSRSIFTFQAKNGMVVAKDIVNNAGQLLAAEGTVITAKVKEMLTFYSIMKIAVYDKMVEVQEETPDELQTETDSSTVKETYAQKIRKSKQYLEFKKTLSENVIKFQDNITNFVNKTENIDLRQLSEEPYSLINESETTIGVFDMLHNIDIYNDTVYSHSLSVALISNVIGRWLDYSPQDLEILTLGGLLHDIGKLLIPQEILDKPGKLTKEEFQLIQLHPIMGYDLIKDEPLDQRVKECILMHHEKCDGTGYPSNLTGDQMSEFAKIVAIADVYAAMTCGKPYREALSPFEVIRLFEEEGFQKYDTRIILNFLQHIGETYVNNTVELSDGRIAKIILINQNYLSKPIVSIGDSVIDLSKEHNLTIGKLL